jgi:glucokinase
MPSVPSVPSNLTVLAADIGATSMRAAAIDGSGRILLRRQVPTEASRGFEDATSRLATLLAEVASEANVSPLAVGVSTAGPVDPSSGEYRHPPNLAGWHGHSMRPVLQEALGVPVVVGHDATVAAIAETRFGHRRGARDLVYLTVSTGIGAGIVSGGRPITGRSGGAGEAGHLIVNPGGPACAAGCPGCLEGASSGAAMAAEVVRRLDAGATTSLTRGATAEDVFRAADAGDSIADQIVVEAMRHLASGIAGLLAVFDPDAP